MVASQAIETSSILVTRYLNQLSRRYLISLIQNRIFYYRLLPVRHKEEDIYFDSLMGNWQTALIWEDSDIIRKKS